MIALLDNMQILVISKKLVNKLHSVGLVTSLWLGVTQRITNKISNFVTCSNNIKEWLDAAASASISASQRIFLARNCTEWCTN